MASTAPDAHVVGHPVRAGRLRHPGRPRHRPGHVRHLAGQRAHPGGGVPDFLVSGGGGYLVDAPTCSSMRADADADDTTMEQRALNEAIAASIALGDPVGAQREIDAVTVPAGSDEGDDETGDRRAGRRRGSGRGRSARRRRGHADRGDAGGGGRPPAAAGCASLPSGPRARCCSQRRRPRAPGFGPRRPHRLRPPRGDEDRRHRDGRLGHRPIGPWMVNWSEGQTILAAGDARRAEGRLDDESLSTG